MSKPACQAEIDALHQDLTALLKKHSARGISGVILFAETNEVPLNIEGTPNIGMLTIAVTHDEKDTPVFGWACHWAEKIKTMLTAGYRDTPGYVERELPATAKLNG